MPRIKDECLECVAYLYSSEDTANAGEGYGGSGFVVGVPVECGENAHHIYAVTNAHVIEMIKAETGNAPVVRRNVESGTTKIDTPDKWHLHRLGEDVAAAHLGIENTANPQPHRFIIIDDLITEEFISRLSIGPGDETFMCGRLIGNDGRQRNTPSARFGFISMMPIEPVETDRGKRNLFIVEVRSIAGYSGSPVFLWLPPLVRDSGHVAVSPPRYQGPWLLGIDCGHPQIADRVCVLNETTQELVATENPKLFVERSSGAALVVPAWRLRELLEDEELQEHRRAEEAEYMRMIVHAKKHCKPD